MPRDDRTPPHSMEAERSVLGALLRDNACLSAVLEEMTAADFYRDINRTVFDAILTLTSRGEPADELTVAEHLRGVGALERVGGMQALGELAMATPTSAHARAYARIVGQRAVRRRIIASAAAAIERAQQASDDETAGVADFAQRTMQGVARGTARVGAVHIRQVMTEAFHDLEALSARGSEVTGVPTGFTELDVKLAGLQRGDLIIVAGRPSMGKTAFALNVVANAARSGTPVAVFSLEMSRKQLANRLMGSEGGVHLGLMRTGRLAPGDWAKAGAAAAAVSEAPIFIDDRRTMTVFDVRAEARRLKAEDDIGLIAVDYLQLLESEHGAENRTQAINRITRGLKALAGELDVPVMALSQLSREVDKRPDKRPVMSDLRDSGGIEQDADVILFMHRDEYYNRASQQKGKAEVIIAKQRNGPTGKVLLGFKPHLTRFEDLPREPAGVPDGQGAPSHYSDTDGDDD